MPPAVRQLQDRDHPPPLPVFLHPGLIVHEIEHRLRRKLRHPLEGILEPEVVMVMSMYWGSQGNQHSRVKEEEEGEGEGELQRQPQHSRVVCFPSR